MRWLAARFRDEALPPVPPRGRHDFQWTARREALVTEVLPVLERHVTADLDEHAYERLTEMTTRYADTIARLRSRAALAA